MTETREQLRPRTVPEMEAYGQPYYGFTYPRFLQGGLAQWLWRKVFCPRRCHLWDEVGSIEHYLSCDACGEVLPISAQQPVTECGNE